MNRFRLLRALLLTFALLFVQQGATAHVLGHLTEHMQHQDGKPAPADTCELCTAFAHFDHALHSSPPTLTPHHSPRLADAGEHATFVPFTPQAAAARAPPFSSPSA